MAKTDEQIAQELKCWGIFLCCWWPFLGLITPAGICAAAVGFTICCAHGATQMKQQVGCIRCGSITGLIFAIIFMAILLACGIIILVNFGALCDCLFNESGTLNTLQGAIDCANLGAFGVDAQELRDAFNNRNINPCDAVKGLGAFLTVWGSFIYLFAVVAFIVVLCKVGPLQRATSTQGGVQGGPTYAQGVAMSGV